MKKIKLIAVWCICLLLIIAISPFSDAESLYSSVIRIHVIANSDSESDQELKLKVRDAIIEYSKEAFNGAKGIEEAKAIVKDTIPAIEEIAENCIAQNGYSYKAKVFFDEEDYPTRNYLSLSLPGGRYLSLRIVIGSGEGQNWWCVLFPPVCTSSAVDTEKLLEESGIGEKNIRTVTRNGKVYELRFKFMEIISEVKEKLSGRF